jgi:anti-anti-sigma factor
MKVKIDTREKFHVITIQESSLAANMTAELDKRLLPFIETQPGNVVLTIEDIENIDSAAASHLLKIQQQFYENQRSFVICHLRPSVKTALEEYGIFELINVTPTESEAWDIVQMEEIERDLLGGG